jgi:hypothetical protein
MRTRDINVGLMLDNFADMRRLGHIAARYDSADNTQFCVRCRDCKAPYLLATAYPLTCQEAQQAGTYYAPDDDERFRIMLDRWQARNRAAA